MSNIGDTSEKTGQIKRIFTDFTNANDFTFVKGELWGSGASGDTTVIKRYRITDDGLLLLGIIKTDFGHLNCFDYNPANDCLIFGNGGNDFSTEGNWFAVVKNPMGLVTSEWSANATLAANAIVYNVDIGFKVQAVWGASNLGLNNIVYLLSNNAKTVTKVLLNVDDNGELNGQFTVLDTHTSETAYPVGGAKFWGDTLYFGYSDIGYKIAKMSMSDYSVSVTKRQLYEANGTEISGTVQGLHIDDKYVWVFINATNPIRYYLIQMYQCLGSLSGGSGGAGTTITVDAELSATSKNPVQNKAVKAALANKAGAEQLEKVINACCDVKTVSGGNYNLMKVSEVSFSSRLQDNVEGIVSSTAANFVTGWIPVTYGKYYAFSIKANGERTTYPNAPLIQRINAKKSDGTILVYNKYPEIVYNKNNQVAIFVPTDVVEMMIHINATVVTDVSTAEKLKVIEPMVVEGKTADEARTNAITKTYVDGDAVVPSELAYTLKHDDTKADKEQTSPYRRSINWGVIPSAYYKGVNSQYATTFTKNTTYATFIAAWKTLITGHSGYVTETTLGQASDEQNIYLYDFKPAKLSNQKNAIPKIIIVAGQHGFEKSNIYGLYCFVDNLLNRWRQHSVLEYLRNHVELMIIPVLNTYGFDHLTYKNGNGVNLNRNYDSHWQLNADPTSEQYGGAAPFNQPETQIVRTLLQGNTDASLVIDFHTNGSSSVAQYSYINYYGVCQSTDAYYNRLLDAVAYQLSSISANFNVDYELNQPNTILGFLNNSAGIGLLRDWATDNNFAGMLLEGFNGFPNDAEFTEDVYKANEEILVNWLITAANYLGNQGI